MTKVNITDKKLIRCCISSRYGFKALRVLTPKEAEKRCSWLVRSIQSKFPKEEVDTGVFVLIKQPNVIAFLRKGEFQWADQAHSGKSLL